MADTLGPLLAEIRACEVCRDGLELGPRPVVQVGSRARIVIIGQAPGLRVPESGVPWDDPSGVRLREWLGVTDAQFYDPDVVALVPMGFCYPGKGPTGGLPPRTECAPLWHDRVLAELPDERLEVIIGQYAQARYVEQQGRTLTGTVRGWADHLPEQVVMPHPSPRNRRWLTQNPWFEAEALPAIRTRVREVLAPDVA